MNDENIAAIEKSKYDGKCKQCGDSYSVGDRVFVWNKNYFKHVDCAEKFREEHLYEHQLTTQTVNNNNITHRESKQPIRVIVILADGSSFVYGPGVPL